MEQDKPSTTIIIWPNGKSKDAIYKIKINPEIDSIRKLKELIIYEKKYSKSLYDKMIFYNYKGIELDDSDISYLQNNQLIYLSLDNSRFNTLNYVNEYDYIKQIKKGGYAEVYLAKNTITNQQVAIKKTDLHNFSVEELYNISREAIYLMNLTNKNIVKIYNSYVYNNCLYNVMAYCEGGELSQLISNPEPIPEKRIKEIFKQITDAVKYIHERNVVHRDLKPNNILFLDKEMKHIVIIDFGISGMNNGFNKEIVKAGTLKYVPPELLCRDDKLASSSKIDIWALGIILYLLYFKEFPFDGKNDNEIIKKIIKNSLEFPKGVKIKISLINLLEGLLNKDYNRRIEINDELFDKWFNDEGNEYKVFSNKGGRGIKGKAGVNNNSLHSRSLEKKHVNSPVKYGGNRGVNNINDSGSAPSNAKKSGKLGSSENIFKK